MPIDQSEEKGCRGENPTFGDEVESGTLEQREVFADRSIPGVALDGRCTRQTSTQHEVDSAVKVGEVGKAQKESAFFR
jgi:hypothetical protein